MPAVTLIGESMIIELKTHVDVVRGDGTTYVAQAGRRVNYHCKRRIDRQLIHEFSVYEAKSGHFHKHTQVSAGDTPETGRPSWL